MNQRERGEESVRLSVIVPTLNEAAWLPALLAALQHQTRPPDEVIVADARSTDGTAEVAQAYGARVVAGGSPGTGRNAGAAAATGNVLLFLDADVLPGPEFIASLLGQFTRNQCDVGTGAPMPLSDGAFDRLIACLHTASIKVLSEFLPHGLGFCTVIRRTLHEAIGGFDEEIAMAEDLDYAARAARLGKFCVLDEARLLVSRRRWHRDGYARTALKYLWCEWRFMTGRAIYELPFAYDFGHYGTEANQVPDGDGLALATVVEESVRRTNGQAAAGANTTSGASQARASLPE